MVWRRANRLTYETDVRPIVGTPVVCSCGTKDKPTATRMKAWADEITARQDTLGVVAGIVARELTLKEAYHLGEIAAADRLAAKRAAKLQASKEIDVWPVLDAWTRERSRGKKPVKTAATQLQMMRHVFPEDPCSVTLWTADEIERRLTTLQGKTWKGNARAMQDATRNRYRNVISVAVTHLRRVKLLDGNPMELVERYDENALTFAYLELSDARTLIEALDTESQVAAALALGFGMERSALAMAEVRDLNTVEWSAHVHGPKTHWRDRNVPLSDVFAFLRPILTKAVSGKLPRAKLVTGDLAQILDRQKASAIRLGLTPITLHQWRHTCAVALAMAGESADVIAHVLGHKDTAMVIKRYARFLVRAVHFVTRTRAETTNPTTISPKEAKAK